MRPEERIEKRFVKKIKELGYKSYKMVIAGEKGSYDQWVPLPGEKLFLFEFKAPGIKDGRSHHQKEFAKWWEEFDFDCYEVDSWEKPLKIVENYLERYFAED